MSDSRMHSQRLWDPSQLRERLEDPEVVVLEIARERPEPSSDPRHVAGAQVALWKELLWHPTERRLASADTLRLRLESLGVTSQSTLVLYGDPVQFGTYAFWTLETAGVGAQVVLLDGGATAWRAMGFPMVDSGQVGVADLPVGADGDPARGATTHEGSEDRATRDDVLARVGSPDCLILDARSAEEYAGERLRPYAAGFDHGAVQYGRIPGAIHLPYTGLLDSETRFLPPAELAAAMRKVGAPSASEVLTYCRLSHRASLVWFAMRHVLGYSNVRVYDGSWTEWGSMVGMPVER